MRYPDSLLLDYPCRTIPVLPFVPNSGITLLGVPIDIPGSSECTASHWASTVDKSTMLLERLSLVPEGQIQHALLRYYLDACRVVPVQRSTIVDRARDAPMRLHESLRRAVEERVGMGIAPATWSQATLPMRHGGLGIRSPLQTQPAARLAALLGLELHGRDRVGVPDVAFIHRSPDLASTIDALCSQVGPHFQPLAEWKANLRKFASASFTHASQRWWGGARCRGAAFTTL